MADTDLLTPVAPEEKWHPYFKALITFAGLAPARDMIRQVWRLFPNPDNHFELEFQTTGLDAESNLFIDAAGEWDRSAYLPAFVRRYPLCLSKLCRAVTCDPPARFEKLREFAQRHGLAAEARYFAEAAKRTR